MGILDKIDQAVGCQQCTGPLGASPSDDFCSEHCQVLWQAAAADLLVSYDEPWDLVPVRTAARHRPPLEFRLPPQSRDLAADMRALLTAEHSAETDDQRAAVELRRQQLGDRAGAALRAFMAGAQAIAVEIDKVFRALADALRDALGGHRSGPVFQARPPHAEQYGPPQMRRPPRTLGREHTAARR